VALPDPTTISGPVGSRVAIPTPDGTGEATHPSVVKLDAPVAGFTYWMAFTPYAGGDDEHEDPCIAASNDGVTWVVPPGLVNPIDNQPGSPGAYNSDVDLRYYDGVFTLVWRTYDPAATGAEEKLYFSTSADGIGWAPKTLFYSSSQSVRRLLSPCVLREAGAWVMWAVDIVPSPNQAVRVQGGAALTDAWADPVGVSMGAMQPGKEPWHLGLIRVDDGYVGLLTDCTQDLSGRDGDLLLVVSSDGLTFTNSGSTVIPREQPGEHDQLYRAALLPETVNSVEGFRVWYSAWLLGPPQVWHIYRTWIGPSGGDTPTPVPPPAFATAAVRDHVTWLGVDRSTGRIIAELPDITGEPQRILSAYASTEVGVPVARGGPGYVPVQIIDACMDGRTGALVAVINDLPLWMGLPVNPRKGSKGYRASCNTPESYLLKRRVRQDVTHTDTDRSLVALALAQQAEDIDGLGQGLHLEYDVSLTGDPVTITYTATDRQTVYDAIRDLCVGGLEFEVYLDWADARQTTITKILRIARRIGRVSGTPAAMFETGDAGSVVDYEELASFAEGAYANHTTGLGPGQGDSQPVSTPVINTAELAGGVPIVEAVVTGGNNINTTDLVQEYAASEAVRMADGASTIDVEAAIDGYPRLGVDAVLGDQVSYRLESAAHPAPSAMDPTDLRLVGERRMTAWSINPAAGTWKTSLVADPTLEEA